MLTDETKNQIRNEEIYRLEIQEDLRKSKKDKNKIWIFLNSSFGIWLLSSVALSIITWGYTQITSAVSENRKNLIDIAKHDAEIGTRIKSYKIKLSKSQSISEYFEANNCFIVGQCYDLNSQTTLPEFKDKNLRALLLELTIIVSSERKSQIQKAIDGLDELNQTQILQRNIYDRQELRNSLDIEMKSNRKKLLNILKNNFNDINWN